MHILLMLLCSPSHVSAVADRFSKVSSPLEAIWNAAGLWTDGKAA